MLRPGSLFACNRHPIRSLIKITTRTHNQQMAEKQAGSFFWRQDAFPVGGWPSPVDSEKNASLKRDFAVKEQPVVIDADFADEISARIVRICLGFDLDQHAAVANAKAHVFPGPIFK